MRRLCATHKIPDCHAGTPEVHGAMRSGDSRQLCDTQQQHTRATYLRLYAPKWHDERKAQQCNHAVLLPPAARLYCISLLL